MGFVQVVNKQKLLGGRGLDRKIKVIPEYCTAHPVLRIQCVNIYKLVKFVTS